MISRNTRLLSFLLVAFMMISTLASLSILPVLADETDEGNGKVDAVVDGTEETSLELIFGFFFVGLFDGAGNTIAGVAHQHIQATFFTADVFDGAL